ncbi:uncharacterized protein BJ171DRAFT_516049 [Polychytrium aggregatum]|uniref:uncharacterized protein n=1 Tax=Polychytrium aggregatum TaxID=110093 RepID=UPI0022FEDFC0|nr:uncharacterized protein BJ171DRAFT_516049 [Polychytrium aggregatum]KAI9201959.1 hypothetical protein BJ171DRAFT_516049 [Polychytrium aggregatum]
MFRRFIGRLAPPVIPDDDATPTDSPSSQAQPRYRCERRTNLALVLALRRLLVAHFCDPSTPVLPVEVLLTILQYAELVPVVSLRSTSPADNLREADEIWMAYTIPRLAGLRHLRRIQFSVESHDQGWSNGEGKGTFHNSWTWGELLVRRPDGSVNPLLAGGSQTFGTTDRIRLFLNLSAVLDWKEWNFDSDEATPPFVHLIQPGDTLEVRLRSVFPGWAISAKDGNLTLQFEP